MAVTLRPYQERAVQEVRQAFVGGHRCVLLQLPTGGGKTITAGYVQGSAKAKGNSSYFMCNRVELVKQTCRAMDRLGLRYGIVAAGFTPSPRELIQVCSVDTMRQRYLKLPKPKLVIWDECRSIAAAGWAKMMTHWDEANHLGLDATPIRLDGTGLGNFFSHMVQGPSYSELMALGNLVPFRVFLPGGGADMSGVHTKRGEFDQAESEAVMDKPSLVGDVVDHYLRAARGLRGITFAVSRKHSIHLAEQFCSRGVPAMHLDGDTDPAIREKAVSDFRRGKILQLVNVNLFSAGFDVPGVRVISDAAPTQSLAMFLQRAGRGSRPDEEDPDKKDCLLLDHAGNVLRHGLPDEDREWSLEGKEKKRGKKKDEPAVSVTVCETCFASYNPIKPKCPECGTAREVKARKMEEHEGELQEMSAEEVAALRRQKSKEVGMAKSLADLEAIGRERGYKDGWARMVWRTKTGKGAARAQAQFDAYSRR